MNKRFQVEKEVNKNSLMINDILNKASKCKGKVPIKLVNEYERLMKRRNLLMEDLERFS